MNGFACLWHWKFGGAHEVEVGNNAPGFIVTLL